jgi:four helix bundle protein
MHHDLRAWQEAMALVNAVYLATARFPEAERFGLVPQMRRAAVSVPSNIAEGAARGSKKEFTRFLLIARGSLSELDTQFRVASNLKYCDGLVILKQIESLFGTLGSLIKSQRAQAKPAMPLTPNS